MSPKDKFVEMFKEKTGGQHPNDYKDNPRALSDIIKSNDELQQAWKEALLDLVCPVCKKSVVINEENTCSECNKVFCDDHNTVGSQWNGKDSKYEHLSTQCEDCAISYISGEADYIHDMRRDDEQETG